MSKLRWEFIFPLDSGEEMRVYSLISDMQTEETEKRKTLIEKERHIYITIDSILIAKCILRISIFRIISSMCVL